MFPETSMTLLEQKVRIVCLTGKQFYAFEIKTKMDWTYFQVITGKFQWYTSKE